MNVEEADALAVHLAALLEEGRRADRAIIKRARTGHPIQKLVARRIYHQMLPAGMPHTPWNLALVERVAALFVLNPGPVGVGESLGGAIKRLSRHPDVSPEAVERRFTALLAAGPDTADTHLARIFVRLHGAGIAIDYSRLARDLQALDHPERWVQRRWADQFWGPGPDEPSPTNASPTGANQ